MNWYSREKLLTQYYFFVKFFSFLKKTQELLIQFSSKFKMYYFKNTTTKCENFKEIHQVVSKVFFRKNFSFSLLITQELSNQFPQKFNMYNFKSSTIMCENFKGIHWVVLKLFLRKNISFFENYSRTIHPILTKI